MHTDLDKPARGWRRSLYTVIYESDTPAGRRFDQILIWTILISVVAVILDSVASIAEVHGSLLNVLEWGFTVVFTIEYVLRLACIERPRKYALSFFGIIDLLSILPSYLALIEPGALFFLDVRILRLMRVFRVFKLTGFVSEYTVLGLALLASRRKIMVFMSFVLMISLLMATAMYVIEGPEHGFTSIPTSMYWAITTMTTVGFGDITPKTDIGRLISSFVMLMGWSVLAVPTGIVTAELTAKRRLAAAGAPLDATPSQFSDDVVCPRCDAIDQHPQGRYCWRCGTDLLPK
jgi:voltage-gated potassium channel